MIALTSSPDSMAALNTILPTPLKPLIPILGGNILVGEGDLYSSVDCSSCSGGGNGDKGGGSGVGSLGGVGSFCNTIGLGSFGF